MASQMQTPLRLSSDTNALSPSSSELSDARVKQLEPAVEHDDALDDDDAVAIDTPVEKDLTALSPSSTRPDDSNQHDDDDSSSSGGPKEDELRSVSVSELCPSITIDNDSSFDRKQPEQPQSEQPDQLQHDYDAEQPALQPEQLPERIDHTQLQTSLEMLEIARLRSENQTLALKLRDVSVQYERHVRSLEAQLRQQVAAHERAVADAQREAEVLRRAQVVAVDEARRAHAQVQVLTERLAQVARLQSQPQSLSLAPQAVERSSAANNEEPEQEQHAAIEPTLPQPLPLIQQPNFVLATSDEHPHSVRQSIIHPPRADATHISCHAPSIRADAHTVRATRLGQSRAAPARSGGSGSGAQSTADAAPGATRMVPPRTNLFYWGEQSDADDADNSMPARGRSRVHDRSSTLSYTDEQPPPPIGYEPSSSQE